MILEINSIPSLTVNVPLMINPKLGHDPDLLIDIKSFMPVVVSATDKNNIRIHSSFSLADLDRDAGERLCALVGFIRASQKASNQNLYVGCTHAVAEQIAYLAYWKDYPLEFHMERFGKSIVVMAHFPKQPEFDCILAVFYNRRDLHSGVQKWFDCFGRLVQDHAKSWQIHLIVDKPTYRKLEEPRFFDPGTCPDEALALLIEQYRKPYAAEMIKTVEGMSRPVSTTTFMHGNAVDL